MRRYHTGSALAITCGVAATGGALIILLADPYMTGTWRLDHVLLPLIVAITIASSHLFGTAVRQWRLLPALGFVFIFAMGTALTVYSSVGAQKSGAEARQVVKVASHNGALEAKRADIEHARARFRQAEAMADREMTGERCRDRCKDWRLRAKEVQARIDALDRELAGLGSEQVAPSKARPLSVAMGVLGYDVAAVETVAATFEPFAYALMFEMTAIVAFGFGFGRVREREEKPADVEALTFERPPEKPLTPQEIADLLKYIYGAGKPLHNNALAALAGISAGECTKRSQEAEKLGLLTRRREGKYVYIMPRETARLH